MSLDSELAKTQRGRRAKSLTRIGKTQENLFKYKNIKMYTCLGTHTAEVKLSESNSVKSILAHD